MTVQVLQICQMVGEKRPHRSDAADRLPDQQIHFAAGPARLVTQGIGVHSGADVGAIDRKPIAPGSIRGQIRSDSRPAP